MLYIVPAAGYYYDYLYIDSIFNNWEPCRVGRETFPAAHPQLLGGKFAVWNDHIGNGISTLDSNDRSFPALQVLSQKMWRSKDPVLTTKEFRTLMAKKVNAPDINLSAYVPTSPDRIAVKAFAQPQTCTRDAVLSLTQAGTLQSAQTGKAPAQLLVVTQIGWRQDGGYIATFDLYLSPKPRPNDTLMTSPYAVLKVSQGNTGKLGFSRDGYDYAFNYQVPVKQWVGITIVGDHRGTTLFVNGKEVDKLQGRRVTYPSKKSTACIQTLTFPFQKVGGFDGQIKNFLVKTGKK